MHGAVHDFIVIHTVKDGDTYHTGEQHGGGPVKNFIKYDYKNLTEQPKYNKILDIGALDICGNQRDYAFLGNGPTWLGLVSDTGDYTGIDIMAGKNVDIVMNAHDLKFEDKLFDLVLCLQVLEHDDDPKQTIKEAYRVLQPGGVFILTFALEGAGEHKHLGGGSEVYTRISEKQIALWLKNLKFRHKESVVIENNYFLYAVK